MEERIRAEFAPAREAAEWANDAIPELEAAAETFFQNGATKIVTDLDRKTGEYTRKIKLVKPLPRDLRRRATEGLIHARHSFDQATFAARNLLGNRSLDSIYFPWGENPSDFESRLKRSGVDQRLWDVFAGEEPYPTSDAYAGGNDIARALAKIANGKHTVGLSVNLSLGAITYHGGIHVSQARLFAIPVPRWDPVKNEAVLLRWIGHLQPGYDYTIRCHIMLEDSRLPEPVDVIGALTDFAAKAQGFVERLERRCVELLC